jgi:hypothetical protein
MHFKILKFSIWKPHEDLLQKPNNLKVTLCFGRSNFDVGDDDDYDDDDEDDDNNNNNIIQFN